MGEIVNLRRARKHREREAEAEAAAENRARHGRTIAQQQNDRRDEARRNATLDRACVAPGNRHDPNDKK